MATAGVLRFNVKERWEPDRSLLRKKQKLSRRRETVTCKRCKSLKVSCDRKQPCERCVWSGAPETCSYNRFPINNNSAGHGQATLDSDESTADITPSLSTNFRPPVTRHVTTIPYNKLSNLSTSAIEWQLSKARTGLCQHLDCALECFNNRLADPQFAHRGDTHWYPALRRSGVTVSVDLLNLKEIAEEIALDSMCSYRKFIERLPSFPFGTTLSHSRLTRQQILAQYLPARETTEKYIATYFESVEATTRLFCMQTFSGELEQFWYNPSSANFDWLAQLFGILAVGSLASEPQYIDQHDMLHLSQRYLIAAGRCLVWISYPFDVTLATVRTLCLIITAKRTRAFSCHERDACGPLIEGAMQMCQMIGCHQLRDHDAGARNQENHDTRVKIHVWNTVRYMYLQYCMHAGVCVSLPMPAACSMDENYEDLPLELRENQSPCRHARDRAVLDAEQLLHQSLPIAFQIVGHANSRYLALPSAAVLIAAHKAIRALLEQVDLISCNADTSLTWVRLQKYHLTIFFRRLLLVIYQLDYRRCYAATQAGQDVSPLFPTTSSAECAIAILVQQRDLQGESTTTSTPMRVLGALHREDFFVAALIVYSEWMCTKNNAPSEHSNYHDSHLLSAQQQNETIFQGLRSCREIWEMETQLSICNRAFCAALAKIVAGMEAMLIRDTKESLA